MWIVDIETVSTQELPQVTGVVVIRDLSLEAVDEVHGPAVSDELLRRQSSQSSVDDLRPGRNKFAMILEHL